MCDIHFIKTANDVEMKFNSLELIAVIMFIIHLIDIWEYRAREHPLMFIY